MRTIKPQELDFDSVNFPRHYANQSIEPIEYMRAAMTNEEFIGYCCGNVIKYCSRWRFKGGVEDLRKARRYLDWMIEAIEGEKAKEPAPVWDKMDITKTSEPYIYPTITGNAADACEKPMNTFDEV